jgi:hypothetical protein
MSPRDSTLWVQARRARDKVAEQYINHPDVILIDIGYEPEDSEEVVLRIHIRQRRLLAEPEEHTTFPQQVDGFPIRIIPGEYRPEIDAPTVEEE